MSHKVANVHRNVRKNGQHQNPRTRPTAIMPLKPTCHARDHDRLTRQGGNKAANCRIRHNGQDPIQHDQQHTELTQPPARQGAQPVEQIGRYKNQQNIHRRKPPQRGERSKDGSHQLFSLQAVPRLKHAEEQDEWHTVKEHLPQQGPSSSQLALKCQLRVGQVPHRDYKKHGNGNTPRRVQHAMQHHARNGPGESGNRLSIMNHEMMSHYEPHRDDAQKLNL